MPRNGFRYARGGGRHFDAQPGIHPTNVLVPGDVDSTEELAGLVGDGLYIGRIWYTYPVNGLRAADLLTGLPGPTDIKRELTRALAKLQQPRIEVRRVEVGLPEPAP